MSRLLYYCAALVCMVAPVAVHAAEAPSVVLRYGDSGAQVLLLQLALNNSPDTRVALSGPGSLGQETDYFGTKTLDAVKLFQAKYRAEVLVPAGLSAPSGFVGPLTLKKLKELQVLASSAPPAQAIAVDVYNPASNVEAYISVVKQAGFEQGTSHEHLALIEAKIREQAATTTDATEQFFQQQRELYLKEISERAGRSVIGAWFGTAIGVLADALLPRKAHAQFAGLPFGGYVLYVSPICTCTPFVTQLFVGLANPTLTSNLNLNYVYGTQAFSWYTLPLPGVATLGTYVPGVQSCFFFVPSVPPVCVPIPAMGQITPIVGSSLSPL